MKKRPLSILVVLLAGAAAVAHADTRCATRLVDPDRQLLQSVPRGEMIRTHTGDHPMAPPADPNVGDSWLWYTWRLNGPPQAELKMCTVRGEGEHVYVVVEDSQWLTRVNQADVDAVIEAWDNSSQGIYPDQGIYELNTTHFGPVPDALDNDPKVYVLFYDFDVASDGFFWFFDQYPDGTFEYASNECEVLYINCSDNDPGGSYLISVMAHELEHMIHWLADEDEASWVDEGMGELAMWLYGHPDQIVSFPNNPDNDLTVWNGNFADYVKTYLWTLYFYEQLGGQPAIWTVMHEPANSTVGYENALDQIGSPLSFNDVYADWIVANFIDDTSFEGGRYGYFGAALPAFSAVTKSTYPVPPTNGSVLRYAADYIKFINGQPQRLRFDGTDVGVWKPRVILRSGTTTVDVADIALDAVDFGTYNLFDFGETVDQVVLVVGKLTPSSTTSYQYATEGIPADAVEASDAIGIRLHAGEPNPTSAGGVVRLELRRPQSVDVAVTDVAGRLVRRLAGGLRGAGIHAIAWDGRDEAGRIAPGGVYFVRARGEDGAAVTRWTRVE